MMPAVEFSKLSGKGTQIPDLLASSTDSGFDATGQQQNPVSTASFSVKTGQQPPSEIIDPSGASRSIKTWKGILIVVVEWLVQQGLLRLSDCPVSMPKATSRYLVAVRPVHAEGNNFFAPVKLHDFYVETHASARQLMKEANFLVSRFGQGAVFHMVCSRG
jgi:hypothetical protein